MKKQKRDTEEWGKAYERARRPGLLVQCRQHCHGNELRESADKEEGIKEEGRDHCFAPWGDGDARVGVYFDERGGAGW